MAAKPHPPRLPSAPPLALAATVADPGHLDDNVAIEFVSGTLPKSSITKVEGHLAKCRDCRTLVAALAADGGNDSNAETVPHEKLSPSQVAQLPTRTLTVGDKVGRYLILTTLGTGGMGVVFAAYDPQLDRKVALKLLRAGLNYNTKDARTRLRREAQAIAQLSHPNVVSVYDVGETEGGDLYIAMEFVEGDTLSVWLKKYSRTPREIIDVFLQAARGLIAAHGSGLLHRDFKPDNVLVGGDGRVRVTDFGLARSVMAATEQAKDTASVITALNVDLTATGTVLGTPRYMAPEQLTGPDIDHRADQFSFCVALYEALWGQHPLPGATSVQMLETGALPISPPDLPKIAPSIAKAVMRGLEKERQKRFPNMGALVSELTPAPARTPARYAVAALAAIVLVGGFSAVMWNRSKPDENAYMPVDDQGVQPLIDKLNKSEQDYRILLGQMKNLLQEVQVLRGNTKELEALREKLSRKEEEIQQLIDTVIKLRNSTPSPTNVSSVAQSLAVTHAAASAENDLEGCFVEWNERQAGDADMTIKLTVNQAGHAGSESVIAGPDSVSLKFCVSNALARVKYPSGPDILDLNIKVVWSNGIIGLSPRVVQRRQLPSSLGEL